MRPHRLKRQPPPSAASPERRSTKRSSPEWLDLNSRELLEWIDDLDDTAFGALAGDPAAIARFQELWPQACRCIPPALWEETRQRYLKALIDDWQRSLLAADADDPANVARRLDLLGMLVDH